MDWKEYLTEAKGMKAGFGFAEGDNYAVKIDGLDSNEFFTQSFGRSLSDRKKAQQFTSDSSVKTTYVDAKGKPTMSAVKSWVKENNPTEFYAKWKKDSSSYKDDSVKIFYKK